MFCYKMDKTPITNKKKFNFTLKKNEGNSNNLDCPTTPPGNLEYSPCYILSTQESSEQFDVAWDWNSSRVNEKQRMKKKRLLTQSPKNPIKRHSSNNSIPNFDKLRDELLLLKQQLAVPDDEASLCISPIQENDFKNSEQEMNNFEDHFNDADVLSMSQKLENQGPSEKYDKCQIEKSAFENALNDNLDYIFDCIPDEIDNITTEKIESHKKDESTNVTEQFIETKIFQRTQSNKVLTPSGKVELHRTKSYEMEVVKTCRDLPQHVMDEIEKNRLQALERLKAKKQLCVKSTCSPEEIEKKRLEALRKLEMKRVQTMVEKKRQEALKRLELNKNKNNTVKTSLFK